MAKKQDNRAQPSPRSTPIPAQRQQAAAKPMAVAAKQDSFFIKYAEPLILIGIAFITYLSMRSGLNNLFTNWDDNGYITNDPLIKDVSSAGISKIFSIGHPVDGAVMGNYHPLTILSYAIEYSYKGLEPYIYHLDSLIFHILTTLSVYIFVKVFTRRTVAAAVAALLFGVHPMHVESVAWAAGRKDVIYGMFYMLSCTCYVYYLRTIGSKKIGWYIGMLVLFVASLLAKPVAVTLPAVLFAIDYFEQRKIDAQLFLDKLVPFLISIGFGLLSISAQKQIGALDKLDITFTPIDRLALGCYALTTYLWKAVMPVGLCNFYPYPAPMANGSLPAYFYGYVVVVLAFIGLFCWAVAKKIRPVVFGIAFFVINIVLLLQFMPVGAAIVADRYSYIPYVGLFIMLGWGVSYFFEPAGQSASGGAKLGALTITNTGKYILAAVVAYCLVLGYMSSERCKVWYDSVTLWRNEVDEHPESPNAYNNLGAIYSERVPGSKTPQERQSNYDSSMYFLNKAIEINPSFINSLICKGILQRTNGETDNAEHTLYKARAVNAGNAEVYLELGVVYAIKQQFDSAGYSFRKALELKPEFPEAHANYANFLDITGHIDSSLAQYAVAIQQNPDAYIPYLNRARIYTRQVKYADALKDYNMAVQKSPDMAEIYYSRSQCYKGMGNKTLALQDANKAVSLGSTQVTAAYMQELKN